MILSADPSITSPVEQFMHQFGHPIMLVICLFLMWLGIKKQFEPLLLVPIAFGGFLSNIPVCDIAGAHGFLGIIYEAGIHQGLFPLIIFMGVGAMTDFGPLIANPKMALLGGAAQFGIFGALLLALCVFGFTLPQSGAIGIIGGADGPTSIFVTSKLAPELLGAIAVAAYSYMALVPIIQPPVIKLLTTEKERKIRMKYKPSQVSKLTKILFPIVITIIAGVVSPNSVALVGFLMFGNLIRECGVLDSLSETAQRVLANLVTIFLGITIATQMQFDKFLRRETLLILGLGFIAFIFDTAGGVIFAKFLNLFLKEKINPMIGAAGISAFPMSGRVVHKMGLAEDPQNFLLMQSMGVNVSGQIASVIAGGLILNFFA